MATQFLRTIVNSIIGNAQNNGTAVDVIGLTERLVSELQAQERIPTVRELSLGSPSPTRRDVANALLIASNWVTDQVEVVGCPAASDIGWKWRELHPEGSHNKILQLPVWVLKILLVECWKDVRRVHNGGHVEDEE